MGRSKKNAKNATLTQNSSCNASKKLPPVMKQQISHQVDKLLQICGQPPTGNSQQLWEEFLTVNSILEKIQDLEKPLLLPPRKREDNFADFLSWVNESEPQPTKMAIALFEDEWGLKAEKDIKEGELWLTMPKKLMMTLQTALQSPLGEIVHNDPILSNMPQVVLTLHLLDETLKPDSLWASYIKILPSEYNTVLYFTPQELNLLKGSPVYDESLKHIRNISRQYAYFWRLFQKIANPQLENLVNQFCFTSYRWAVSSVMTRQNAIPTQVEATPTSPALIPLWDMCNHGHGEISTDYNLQLERLQCYSMRNVNAGQQMLIHYGDRTTAQLFVHNGFVDVQHEESSSVSIRLGVSKNDPLYIQKNALLAKLQLHNQQVFEILGKGHLHPDLAAFARIFCMDSGELELQLADSDKSKLRAVPLDDPRCKQFLSVRIKLILRGYEDMETSLNSPRAKMAISLRRLEKQTLNSALDHLQSN